MTRLFEPEGKVWSKCRLLSMRFNALAGGDPTQPFSARSYQDHLLGNFNIAVLIDIVFFILSLGLHKDHSYKSFRYWVEHGKKK